MRWARDHTLRGGCSREVGCGMEREAWERRGLSDTKVTGGVQGTVPSGASSRRAAGSLEGLLPAWSCSNLIC